MKDELRPMEFKLEVHPLEHVLTARCMISETEYAKLKKIILMMMVPPSSSVSIDIVKQPQE